MLEMISHFLNIYDKLKNNRFVPETNTNGSRAPREISKHYRELMTCQPTTDPPPDFLPHEQQLESSLCPPSECVFLGPSPTCLSIWETSWC